MGEVTDTGTGLPTVNLVATVMANKAEDWGCNDTESSQMTVFGDQKTQ